MYTPSSFSTTDPVVIREFIEANNFGILVSKDGDTLHDTHTPFLVSGDLKSMRGHIARANRQWQSWADEATVKVIFHGPHAYISPRYYQSTFNVPTWNYSAVSVDGRIKVIEDRQECVGFIQDLVAKHEGPSGWKLDVEDERSMKLFDALVCFSIEVEKIGATFKLNQNKTGEDRESVISHLQASPHAMDRLTAELMAAQGK